MKKISSLVILVLFIVSLVPAAFAQDAEVGDTEAAEPDTVDVDHPDRLREEVRDRVEDRVKNRESAQVGTSSILQIALHSLTKILQKFSAFGYAPFQGGLSRNSGWGVPPGVFEAACVVMLEFRGHGIRRATNARHVPY